MAEEPILCDTSVLYALVSSRDQNHQKARIDHDRLKLAGTRVLIPRMAWVETASHVFRNLPHRGRKAAEFIEQLTSYGQLVEHESEDYRQAVELRRQYSDWGLLEFPDLVIVSTAVRMTIKRLWAFDFPLSRFLVAADLGVATIPWNNMAEGPT